MKTYNPLIVSNNIIEKARNEKIPLSPMKLQKLLYFLYRECLQNKSIGIPIFAERFEAWQYGPVLPSVYYTFKHYGAASIMEYCSINKEKAMKVNEAVEPMFIVLLNEVWNKFKRFSGIELSKMTHQEGTAWYKAWCEDLTFLSDNDIKDESIKVEAHT